MSNVRWMEQVDSHWLGYDAARQRWRPLLEFNHMDDYVEALLSGDYSLLCEWSALTRDRAELGPWPWQWFASRLIEHLDALPADALSWFETPWRDRRRWHDAYFDSLFHGPAWWQYGDWPEGYDGWPWTTGGFGLRDHPDYAALASAWLWD